MRAAHLIAWLALQGGATAHAASEEPWFNPPGGTWIPNSAVVSAMKADFDAAIPPKLAAKVPATAPPTQYWFQYQGAGSGSSRTILLIGRPFPVPSRARQDLLSVFIPESCVIFAIYIPSERTYSRLEVGGLSCPPRI
jgi:hypothetical protein